MVGSVERKIYFLKGTFRRDNQVVDIATIFKLIDTFDYHERYDGRYFELEDGNLRSLRINSLDIPIQGYISTIRKYNLPYFERMGTAIPITLPDGVNGLMEPSHFIIFPNNVIGFESNFYGPNANALKNYLLNKAPSLINSAEIKNIPMYDVFTKINRSKGIRGFTLRIHRDLVPRVEDLHESLFASFDNGRLTSDAEFLEVSFTAKKYSRSNSISLPFVGQIPIWLTDEIKPGVDRLNIDVIMDEGIEAINVLQQDLYSMRSVYRDNLYRSVDENSIYTAIRRAYNELKPEINRKLGINDGN